MLKEQAVLLSNESAQILKSDALLYRQIHYPPSGSGQYYFVKNDDITGVEPGEMMIFGEFADTDITITDAIARCKDLPIPPVIYDTRSGAKRIYSSGNYDVHATDNLWKDIGVGRMLHCVYTSTTFFIVSFGNAIRINTAAAVL